MNFIIDTVHTNQFLELNITKQQRLQGLCVEYFRLKPDEKPEELHSPYLKTIYSLLDHIRVNFTSLIYQIFRVELPPIKRLIVRILDFPIKFVDSEVDSVNIGEMCLKDGNKIIRNWKWIKTDVLIYLGIAPEYLKRFKAKGLIGLLFHEIGHIYQMYWMINNIQTFDKIAFDLTHQIIDALTNCRFSYCNDKTEKQILDLFIKDKTLTIYDLFEIYMQKNRR